MSVKQKKRKDRKDEVLQIWCNLWELISERVSIIQFFLNWTSFCGVVEFLVDSGFVWFLLSFLLKWLLVEFLDFVVELKRMFCFVDF